jgi:fructose-1,6-bisphosphatase-3
MNGFAESELLEKKEYLELLSEKFGNIPKATSEVVNLKAILNLPKGTEHFLTDIHGEYIAFNHVMRNASGVVKRKIQDVLGKTLPPSEITALAILIYYPEEKLQNIKKNEADLTNWYKVTIYRLIQVCRDASSKYTRSKVRKALPKEFAYMMEELLHEDEERFNKRDYYQKIIDTIVDLDQADDFIIQISAVIQRLTIDHLHILGDVYDRGAGPHYIMDTLIKHHSVDIQWGNHDILWMGAAAGDKACIANAVRICLRYANMDVLEDGYGINMLPLATFAMTAYQDDDCGKFMPKLSANEFLSDNDKNMLAKMHKAISMIQFKLEHQIVMENPDFGMDNRQLLDKIDYENYTILVDGITYPLNTHSFPTVDPQLPWMLTEDEQHVIDRLQMSFLTADNLQKHIRFMYSKGSIYLKYNGNLLFHASIPMNEDGSFKEVTLYGETAAGKALMDKMDQWAREAYFSSSKHTCGSAFLWYLWCNEHSPLFGKDKMATFERYFIEDKVPHKENYTPYFVLVTEEPVAEKVLEAFGLDPLESHIINGHVPVKTKAGESPIKANGKLLVIDGGFAKAYQSTTGIAGYTLIYNSFGLQLASHEPFESVDKAIQEGIDIRSTISVIEKVVERKKVVDTDIGERLKKQIHYLEMLIQAYRKGIVKEKY